jgi:hypothetical protein
MAKSSHVWGVLFTDACLTDLGEALKPYLSKGPIGYYLYCKDVDMGQPYYFHFVAERAAGDGSAFEAELYVPHHYVKAVISAPEKKHLGFV